MDPVASETIYTIAVYHCLAGHVLVNKQIKVVYPQPGRNKWLAEELSLLGNSTVSFKCSRTITVWAGVISLGGSDSSRIHHDAGVTPKYSTS